MNGQDAIRRIVRAYQDPIVRLYAAVRFGILRQRFLEEIGQCLPARGKVVDLGCGFGLFGIYFAMLHPRLSIHGFDLNARRVEMARKTAHDLAVTNVHFETCDARDHVCRGILDGVYMLDLVHHIPQPAGNRSRGQTCKFLGKTQVSVRGDSLGTHFLTRDARKPSIFGDFTP